MQARTKLRSGKGFARRLVGILGGLATVVLLATAVPAGAAGTLDQSQTSDSAGTECLCAPFSRLGQTFTAGTTGNLDQVDLLLYRVGSPGNLSVEIRPVSDGVPSNTILSTATVAESSVPVGNPGWVSVPLSAPAISTAGTQHAIVLSAPGASCGGPCDSFYAWGSALGDPYAGGDAVTSVDSGASWFPLIGLDNTPLDRAFKTYVTPLHPNCNGVPATIYVGADGRIVGGPGNGQLYQGTLIGTTSSDVMVGTNGKDTIGGRGRNDLICGLDDDDTLRGGDGDDTLVGGLGKDVLDGDDGSDTLTGNADADKFKGGGGRDTATDYTPAQGDTKTNVEVF
ncbi:MAG: hypothetical protein ACRDPV_08295 [Gaiellaceae bacterium]